MKYTEEQISAAFKVAYQDQYGNLDGVEDAYEWWLHPTWKCLRTVSPTKPEKRCTKICSNCRTAHLTRDQ